MITMKKISNIETPKNTLRLFCLTMIGDADGYNKNHIDMNFPLSDEDESFLKVFNKFVVKFSKCNGNRRCEINDDINKWLKKVLTAEEYGII